MSLISIIIVALALSMDAFAVAVVSGATYKKLNIKHALTIAAFFGLFQAIMPLIGWLAGITLKDIIADYDHWVAFGLLLLVGSKMIYESFKIKKTSDSIDPTKMLILLWLSIATSIDALAVGVTLSLLAISIVTTVAIIGVITFIVSYLGTIIGKKLEHFFESKFEALGGVILIGLGIKILLQHLLT